MNKNTLIILFGRSCVGKTTTVRELQEKYPTVHEAVSFTTRDIRPNEVDGEDYRFITVEEFKQMSANNELVESVEYNGNYYGLNHKAFDTEKLNIAIVEPSGVNQLKNKLSDKFNIVVVKLEEDDSVIFDRFKKRGDSKEVVFKRFPRDKVKFTEIEYDYLISADLFLLESIIEKHGGF